MKIQITRANFRRQVFFWIVTIFLFGVFLYVFRGILLPFVAGMALAYFLDPVADRLESWRFSRLMATIVIVIAFILVFIGWSAVRGGRSGWQLVHANMELGKGACGHSLAADRDARCCLLPAA